MSAKDLFCDLNSDEYPEVSDKEKAHYEIDDLKDVIREAPKNPTSTEQKDDSSFSQAEFAAHMSRQGGKPREETPTKVPASDPAKAPADGAEDTKKEFSDHLARQGAKKQNPVGGKVSAKGEAKIVDEGVNKEAHDTVVMQTDHVAGKKPDDSPAMPADHVAGRKGEHAVVKIGDKSSSSDDATLEISAEEKSEKQPPSVGDTKAIVLNADNGGADTQKDIEIPERKPGW